MIWYLNHRSLPASFTASSNFTSSNAGNISFAIARADSSAASVICCLSVNRSIALGFTGYYYRFVYHRYRELFTSIACNRRSRVTYITRLKTSFGEL
nr:MAG TPA: hypothetical protein [Caudoviricetes sp.]